MKKFLALAAAAVLCMGAVSCGKKSSEYAAEKSASRDISGDISGDIFDDISGQKNQKVIKVATVSDIGYISGMVQNYNEANPSGEYRMELVNYTYQEDTGQNGFDLLKMDIISGSAPDVITTPVDDIDLNGYYMDLYEFMDSDHDISRDDFIPNILDALSVDGKLPYIVPAFSVNTMLAKSKFPFVKENWSYDEFIDAYDSMPDGMELMDGLDNQTLYDNFCGLVNIYDFVNYDKAVCRFDSPQFVNMMNFVRDNHLGMTQAEAYAWDGSVSALSDPMAVSEDRLLVPVNSFHDFQSIWTSVSYFDDDVTFAGRPSLNGNGSYAVSDIITETELSIPRNAENPEGAWDFIKFFFSDYGYKAHRLQFPAYQEHFDKTADHCLENKPGNEGLAYLPDDGWITAVRYTNPEGTEYEIIEPLTKEELARYKEFVYSAAGHYCRRDSTLERILYEELQEFFNSDKSAEETAAMIQNRASVYLGETYG